tara:strand:+ start:1186 stop:1980 length:795 start_codon:yes stop_codon:yes gene_type:complete
MSEEQTLTMETESNPSDNAESVNDLSNEEKDSLLIGEDLDRKQEGKLAGKYENAKELEKAYLELQGKMGQKSEPDSEDEESKNEPEQESPNEGNENILEALWRQSSENNIDKGLFEELAKMDSIEVAKAAMEMKSRSSSDTGRDFTQQDVQQIHGLVGGQENYNNLLGWASQNIPEQEVSMFDAIMEQGNPMAAYFAVQALALKYADAAGRDGQMVTGKAPKTQANVFNSQAEMVKAMEDPRYHDDPAYRDEIMAKLERSDINF